MIVRLLGCSLAGRVLETADTPCAGGWLTAGDADWGLYVPVHRDPATGIVLAEIWATVPRRTTVSRSESCASAPTNVHRMAHHQLGN
ncbi:hypothetical protein [Streptomyces sp. NPDC006739]|uniref:hypothetical protein n=1 Tax=Streptomyces sp. NPDC006739 TaxID=3364763 RepID=UPI0036767648